MKKLIQVAMVAAALAVAPSAMAAPITGSISFSGDASPTGGANWATATGVNFTDCAGCAAGFEGEVENGIGTYAGLGGLGIDVDFTDFTFSPVLSPNPVNPLWQFSFGGVTYMFALSSIAVDNQGTTIGGQTFLQLSGAGTLTATGFDPTLGFFLFNGGDSGGSFSFRASNVAAGVVPEPGSMLLLGTGLLGLAAVARRRMRKA